uniref:Retrotransposon gag domain-containing protein n=1 Tax=Amphimedon queenslandica TaxID=400682 RepID=A0A1X7T6M4_AMPQE
MAEIRLQAPDSFNFKTPDEWPKWRKRFEQFRIASGLSGDAAAKQVNTLLYCMGDESDAILDSMKVTEVERGDYTVVLRKFDDFFKVRRNVIFERARFNRRSQQEGESTEEFIMELYRLVENCDYGEFQDEMIRDRLVVGIRNQQLSERMQLDPDLNLEKAKKMARQLEAVRDQSRELKRESTT